MTVDFDLIIALCEALWWISIALFTTVGFVKLIRNTFGL